MKKILTLILLIYSGYAVAQAIKPNMTTDQVKSVQKKIQNTLGVYPEIFEAWKGESERKVKLEKIIITPAQNRIHLYLNEPFGQISMREDLISHWEQMVREKLGKDYSTCRVQLYCKDTPAERLVPNYYRNRLAKDASRKDEPSNKVPLTQNMDKPVFGKGLSYKHVALWASHGRYYDDDKKSWLWQRPALFGSMEDLNSFEYTYRYLIPMLENAGAVVVSPRERDPNPTEIIIDEDKAKIVSGSWRSVQGGFGKVGVITDENPFERGAHLVTNNGGSVEYSLNAPKGHYAVYVSYKSHISHVSNAEYEVEHCGGKTSYRVNQQMGAGWIFLGYHLLDKNSKVTVNAKGSATTDAVRIGGGMGNVSRGGSVSGVPRWAEGARYFLQYSGVPSSIYAQDTEKDKKPKDYWDDYKCRGDWTTWLQNEKGIPFDAAVTLHTNAGINDTIFGSLTINYTEKFKGKYTNGKSKMASRDFADIVLSQIVNDLKTKYSKQWARRSMYDKGYREALSPDMPALIIELLSHQNMNDMIYALDPQFRFDACRAIYKGILRFIADRYSMPYVVQPLPPLAFAMKIDGDKLKFNWSAQPDELEQSATSDYFKIYTRIGDGGFDNGTIVRSSEFELPMAKDGVVRSYKVTALNEGGESFPSEILSACFVPGSKKTAMIVNEFTRLSPPDTIRGGLILKDFMPYQHDYGIVGVQQNFDRRSEFVDTENPGWGASTLSLATKGVAGNTFDYTVKKGATLVSEGYSYISSSAAGYDRRRNYDKVVTITGRL